jgi:3-oxoadipate enol-lactonase
MDLAVNAEQRGAGQDLVLIHSLGADLHFWDGVIDAFAAHYRVLRYDVRGHGKTYSDYTTVTIDLMRDDLRALLDGYGIAKAHIVGLSMGGMIAQAFAAACPERVNRLALLDTAAIRDAHMRDAWIERTATARRDGMAPLVEPTVSRWFPEAFRRAGSPVLAPVRATIAAMDPEHYAAAGEALAALDVIDRIGAIRAPTLVGVGSLDEALPPHFAQQIADAIPGARLIVWDGVGHAPPLQIPELFARDVLAFLGELRA